jgi:hypothetical protein
MDRIIRKLTTSRPVVIGVVVIGGVMEFVALRRSPATAPG